ncbi:MAG: hypothetical protein D6791_12265 [Chloroflexi bacterium]|nr:MAG: hypothetical protein D6791_12265 [Chloroflexota bacterium]
MKTKVLLGVSIAGMLVVLLWFVNNAVAQPAQEAPELHDVSVAGSVSSKISYQGVLRENGQPVNGHRDMVFRFYDNGSCSGSPLQEVTRNNVPVDEGRFNVDLSVDPSHFNGRGVWLRVRVEGTNLGCEEILPVPYALSLRPGAHIAGSVTASPYAALHVWNTATTGSAYGVKGGTDSPSGRAVYGDALNGGTGVYAKSDTGVAIKAAGTGVIQSSAKSYVWISGNGVRKFHQNDPTVIDMDTTGGAKVFLGTGSGRYNVMLPITVPGPLYGQDVTITDLDIYWKGNLEADKITAVLLRRQTGVGSYATILHEVGADHTCDGRVHTEGCTLHYDLTSNNVLTVDSGILYITLELSFSADFSPIWIGGVRLTLEHD